jgi:hypothetical protein
MFSYFLNFLIRQFRFIMLSLQVLAIKTQVDLLDDVNLNMLMDVLSKTRVTCHVEDDGAFKLTIRRDLNNISTFNGNLNHIRFEKGQLLLDKDEYSGLRLKWGDDLCHIADNSYDEDSDMEKEWEEWDYYHSLNQEDTKIVLDKIRELVKDDPAKMTAIEKFERRETEKVIIPPEPVVTSTSALINDGLVTISVTTSDLEVVQFSGRACDIREYLSGGLMMGNVMMIWNIDGRGSIRCPGTLRYLDNLTMIEVLEKLYALTGHKAFRSMVDDWAFEQE